MSTAFLFIFATIIVVVFVFSKIADPNSELKSKLPNTTSTDAQHEWNIGAFLLRLGPVLAGFGVLGYLGTTWWDNLQARLILLAIILLGCLTSSALMYNFNQNSKNIKVLAESLLIVASFMIVGVLNTANDLSSQITGGFIFGMSEILGIWFLLTLSIAYLFRSKWILTIALVTNLTWLTTYILTPNKRLAVNFKYLFNIDVNAITLNYFLYYIFAVFSSIGLVLIYAWHQNEKHNLPDSQWRPFYYLTGLMAYLTTGALVFSGIVENFAKFQNPKDGFIADIIVSILTLGIFLIDYICSRSVKNYNINFLTPLVVFTASILGPLIYPGTYFIGFYFIEIMFIVWLLADYLRQKSALSGMLFYTFNIVQLLAISTNQDSFNWFKLIVILGIIMYASIVHFKNRSLVFYTIIAGILALLFKVFASGASGFLVIMVVGLILMAFGLYYTQTRTKILEEQQQQKSSTD